MKIIIAYDQKACMTESVVLELSIKEFLTIKQAMSIMTESMAKTEQSMAKFKVPSDIEMIPVISKHIDASIHAAERQGITLKEVGHG